MPASDDGDSHSSPEKTVIDRKKTGFINYGARKAFCFENILTPPESFRLSFHPLDPTSRKQFIPTWSTKHGWHVSQQNVKSQKTENILLSGFINLHV